MFVLLLLEEKQRLWKYINIILIVVYMLKEIRRMPTFRFINRGKFHLS